MSSFKVEKYISDACDNIEYCEVISKYSKEPLGNGKQFRIATSQLASYKEKVFVSAVMNKLKCVLMYPASDIENENISELLKVFGSRIEFVDHNFLELAAIVDIFISFESNTIIERLLASTKKTFLGSPFRIGMSNIEAKQYYFENHSFIKYYCEQKKLPFSMSTPDDVDVICVGDVLPKDDFDIYTNSHDKGEEQYLLYLLLASKHPMFLERIREINHLSTAFVDPNATLSKWKAFQNCLN
jgi:hypothetical protein